VWVIPQEQEPIRFSRSIDREIQIRQKASEEVLRGDP